MWCEKKIIIDGTKLTRFVRTVESLLMEKFIKLMNLKCKVVVIERLILWKIAWKNSHPSKSYADLFNTQTIFQAWVIFLAFWQIITYNASFYDIIEDFKFLIKILNQSKVYNTCKLCHTSDVEVEF